MKRGTRDRLANVETEARKLARSGEHRGFASIQAALLERGFTEAAVVFRNRWTRAKLDRLCDQAAHITTSRHAWPAMLRRSAEER
jgi:hypothetical protein